MLLEDIPLDVGDNNEHIQEVLIRNAHYKSFSNLRRSLEKIGLTLEIGNLYGKLSEQQSGSKVASNSVLSERFRVKLLQKLEDLERKEFAPPSSTSSSSSSVDVPRRTWKDSIREYPLATDCIGFLVIELRLFDTVTSDHSFLISLGVWPGPSLLSFSRLIP
jgi:hypothetical protein